MSRFARDQAEWAAHRAFMDEFPGVHVGMLATDALGIAARQHRELKARLADVERERDRAIAELERAIAELEHVVTRA